MKMSKNKIIMAAIIALVVIALAVTMVVLLNKDNNDLPAGTDGTTQTTEPSGTESTDPKPTDPQVTTYTVTFKDHDGTVLKTETVEEGKAATAPTNPTREGYTFEGWDKTFDNVTADMEVTATYKAVETKPTDPQVKTYTVTFKDHDGKVLGTQKVEEGKGATAPANPTRTHYTFTGWDKSFNKITADLVVTATYKINEYTVTFKDYNGTVLKTQKVESGKGATAPANPTREHYNFAGWDKTFSSVTSDLIVTAKYTTDKLIISAESVTVNKGTGEVTMNIRVVNNPGIMGAVLKVSVNDEVLGVSGANKVGFPGLTLTAPGSAATSSPYTFMLDSMDLSADDKKDGTLFTITFKIKDTSVTGKYDVKLSCNQGGIFDENYNNLNVTFVNGSITIK